MGGLAARRASPGGLPLCAGAGTGRFLLPRWCWLFCSGVAPDVCKARQGMGGMQMLQEDALNSCRRECKELGKCSLIAALGLQAGGYLRLRSVSSTKTTVSI